MEIFLTATITFCITCLVGLLLVRRLWLRQKKKEDREVRRMLERVVEEQNESKMILAAINMGVLAYGSDGMLLSENQAASEMLPEIPHNFQDFLERYGGESGMRSTLLLGSEQAEAQYSYEGTSLRLQIQKRRFDQSKRPGHIIMIQDVTAQEREDKQRKEFVANVSHELKTPLTIIKTYSESLIDWGISEKNTKSLIKDVTRIYEDSLRMEKLIDDLLLLSRIDGKAMFTRVERSDLMRLVRQITDRLKPQADAKGIDLSCFSVTHLPQVYIDRVAMERIITNLIANALKYTDKSGEVKIYVGFLVEDVYVKVRDNGMGIDEIEQQHIFDRFYRVDTTGSRQYGGTGLGLSIVRELVDLHLGAISVNSSIAQGSEFTVMIPSAAKVMRMALYELTHHGECTNVITQAAEGDLGELAQRLGLVAQWKSLQTSELDQLMHAIQET